MNTGTCPFAAQGHSEPAPAPAPAPAPTCPLGFGSARAAAPDTSSPTLTCPLGFGAGRGTDSTEKRPTPALFASTGLPRMPLAVLAAHPTLVAVKGVVFDVSCVEAYRTRPAASWTGHDASRVIAVSSCAGADVGVGDGNGEGLDEGLSGLRYEEHQRLEAYFLEMARSRRAVAVLTEEDHARIFGAPLTAGSGDATYSPATTTLAPKATKSDTSDRGQENADEGLQPSLLTLAGELHASVEQGDAEAVARVLSLSNHQQSGGDAQEGGVGDDARTGQPQQQRRGLALSHLVDCACPRTGLTPLLKAVEWGSEEVVRVLLEAGGNVQSQAVLYDGDDALALAKRLGCSKAIVEMIQLASINSQR